MRMAASRVKGSSKLNRIQNLYKVSGAAEFFKVAWDWWIFNSLILEQI